MPGKTSAVTAVTAVTVSTNDPTNFLIDMLHWSKHARQNVTAVTASTICAFHVQHHTNISRAHTCVKPCQVRHQPLSHCAHAPTVQSIRRLIVRWLMNRGPTTASHSTHVSVIVTVQSVRTFVLKWFMMNRGPMTVSYVATHTCLLLRAPKGNFAEGGLWNVRPNNLSYRTQALVISLPGWCGMGSG